MEVAIEDQSLVAALELEQIEHTMQRLHVAVQAADHVQHLAARAGRHR
jgi:hypothetical protein